MSSERYGSLEILEHEQPSALDCSINPGTYRSGKRDNRPREEQQPHVEPVRAFLQMAFASGAAEKLDDRRKWVVVRYISDDNLTFEDLYRYAGVTTAGGASATYRRALKIIWEATPPEVRENFSEKEVFRPKRNYPYGHGHSRQLTPETKEKIRTATRAAMTPEVRAKISVTMKGHEVTLETRERMRMAKIGKKASEETKANISAALRGHEVTLETRERIREALKTRKLPSRSDRG